MSSTSTDRSISSNISLPQWMKTKISDRYDWDQAALSPPTESDSFFFIPYPKSETTQVGMDAKHIEPTYLTEVTTDARMKRSPTMPEEQMKLNANLKSNLEDSSSRSMASVAQNMFTGRLFGSYLLANDNSEHKQEDAYHRHRRNSKSLPASPLSSPKTRRKNPYFTDPFAKPNETFEPKSGFILSILSQRKSIEDLVGSTADSSASENNSPKIPRSQPKIPMEHPSELREMNFWSPISM